MSLRLSLFGWFELRRLGCCEQWQAHGEGRARPDRRFNLDPSFVGMHDLAGDEETETETLARRALAVDPVEPVEDMGQDMRGNPGAVIAHIDLGETISLAQ